MILRRNTPRADRTASPVPPASCRRRPCWSRTHRRLRSASTSELAIVDFLRLFADQLDKHVAPARHGHDVASVYHRVGGRVHDLPVLSHAAGRTPAAPGSALRPPAPSFRPPGHARERGRRVASNWCQAVPDHRSASFRRTLPRISCTPLQQYATSRSKCDKKITIC